VREAARQGFRRSVCPAGNARSLGAGGVGVEGIAALDELFDALGFG
jgi:hypothetical protein